MLVIGLDLLYWEILKIKNTCLQFRSICYGWQKNKKKKNSDNYKCYMFYANAIKKLMQNTTSIISYTYTRYDYTGLAYTGLVFPTFEAKFHTCVI